MCEVSTILFIQRFCNIHPPLECVKFFLFSTNSRKRFSLVVFRDFSDGYGFQEEVFHVDFYEYFADRWKG